MLVIYGCGKRPCGADGGTKFKLPQGSLVCGAPREPQFSFDERVHQLIRAGARRGQRITDWLILGLKDIHFACRGKKYFKKKYPAYGRAEARPEVTPMLPHYSDGSKKDPAGKNKGRRKKGQVSSSQVCVAVLLFVGMLWLPIRQIRSAPEGTDGAAAGGLVGLAVLGSNSASGRWWMAKATAYLKSVEEYYPVLGWTGRNSQKTVL